MKLFPRAQVHKPCSWDQSWRGAAQGSGLWVVIDVSVLTWVLQLALLFQVADGHLQDVGFLQLGVGLVPLELLLQEQLQLLNAAVNPIAAQLLYDGFPEL